MTHLGDPVVRQWIVRRIAVLKPGSESRWGRMTVHEMLCHLADSYQASMGERYVSPATSILQRTLVKWAALYIPVHWPKHVPTRPEVEQGVKGTPPGDFERDRDRLIRLIDAFSDPNHRFQWSQHPTFGKMREGDWLRWGYLHADHHLRQFGV